MKLSIVIINFNTPEVTIRCLKSIREQTLGVEYEIILIDNMPNEDFEPEFKAANCNLRYIKSLENIGFGRANNLGMGEAKGEYILLLNSDTLVEDDAIVKCVKYLESGEGKKTDVLGARLLNPNGTYQPSFYPYTRNNFLHYLASNNPILYRLFGVKNDYKEPVKPRPVGDVSGAFMLLRSEVYVETRGFDPDFFLYYEESEWCRGRMRKNFRVTYYPFATVIHLGGQSAPKDYMSIQAMISQGLFWYKMNRFLFVSFIIFNFFNSLFYLLAIPFSRRKKRKELVNNIRVFKNSFSYWLFDIPRYSPKWGSRPSPLIYKKAEKIFFPQ